MKDNKEHTRQSHNKKKLLVSSGIILLIVFGLLISNFTEIRSAKIVQKSMNAWMDVKDRYGEVHIPEEYIPVYMEAAKEYDVPWTLLAAHHRVETRFSSMDPLLSPAGAEGHMQFMPCTFVGWGHPSCEGLGKGDIPDADKTDPQVIAEYGGYGVDANGDGVADPYDIEDAIHSTAHYISSHGASDGELKAAIFEYNRSDTYVEDVLFYYNKFEEIKDQVETKIAQK